LGVMSGLSLGIRASNLKSVALTVLELLAFNAQKFRGSRDHGHDPLWGEFLGVISGQSLGTRVSNVKSIALTVLKLLAVIAQKFRGSRDHGHAPFWGNFGGHVWIVPGNTCVKFEVHSFNRFGAIGI